MPPEPVAAALVSSQRKSFPIFRQSKVSTCVLARGYRIVERLMLWSHRRYRLPIQRHILHIPILAKSHLLRSLCSEALLSVTLAVTRVFN
jgi:hypothetical protein